MPAKTAQLVELGNFLKVRRGQLTPEDSGLPARGTTFRRVSGLRREEVAELAAISQDYYTRIEQGRLAPSEPVLEALIRALKIDDDGSEYLHSLIEKPELPSESAGQAPARARPQLRRLVEQMDSTPAFVFGRYLDILAWNPLMSELLVDLAAMPESQRNYARLVFADPRMREIYRDWDSVAVETVSVLRMDAARYPDDPRLKKLVADLSAADDDFRRLWAQRVVSRQDFGSKLIANDVVGELTLAWDSFEYAGDPEQQMVVWSAPDADSRRKLLELADRTRSGEGSETVSA